METCLTNLLVLDEGINNEEGRGDFLFDILYSYLERRNSIFICNGDG